MVKRRQKAFSRAPSQQSSRNRALFSRATARFSLGWSRDEAIFFAFFVAAFSSSSRAHHDVSLGMAFLDFGSTDPAMNDPLDIDSILMPPPSKRLRGETIVSPEEAHSKGVVLSLPPGRDQRQNSDPAWSTEADLSPFTFKKSQEGFETTVSEELSGKIVSLELPQSVMASRTIPANDTTAPDQGSTFKQRRNVEEESIGTGSETVIDSVNDGSKSAWQTPAKTRFSDIVGHAAAKLRIDEMLLPLALPPSLANSVLSGEH
jgi:hypothetical protein